MKPALIEKVTRKTFKIRESGRSSDYISPSFGFGCLLECGYCYMKRHKPKGLSVAKNTGDILTEINNHAFFYADVPKPNQTDEHFITYDIACNEDFALHAKYHDWQRIFEFFRTHPIAKATLATKIIPIDFLEYNPEGKVRIRFSLMPQKISSILEPNTSLIIDRIKAIDGFIEAGYDVHVNFSPVVVYPGYLEDYAELFEMLEHYIDYKEQVKAEVIFLTHNKSKHIYNLINNIPGEDLLWTPDNQETKNSQYGGENIRYQLGLKAKYIQDFKTLHDFIIPWNTILYIF
jgi:spore photoproduct lyase